MLKKIFALLLIAISTSSCLNIAVLTDNAANDFAPPTHSPGVMIGLSPEIPWTFGLATTNSTVRNKAIQTLSLLNLRIEPVDFLAINLSLFTQSVLIRVKESENIDIMTGLEYSLIPGNMIEIPLGVNLKLSKNSFIWFNLKEGFFHQEFDYESDFFSSKEQCSREISLDGASTNFSVGVGIVPPSGLYFTAYFSYAIPYGYNDSFYCSENQTYNLIFMAGFPVAGISLGWRFAPYLKKANEEN